ERDRRAGEQEPARLRSLRARLAAHAFRLRRRERLDERLPSEDALEEELVVPERREADDPDRRAGALEREQEPRQLADVAARGLEVAHEQDRSMLDAVALQHLHREPEALRDARAAAKRGRPRIGRELRSVRREEAQERL